MSERLSETIESYRRWRSSQDYSANTLDREQCVMRLFIQFTGDIQTKRISSVHIDNYFEQASKTRQGSTLAGDHQILDAWLRWCRHTKRIAGDNDPFFGRRTPRATVKERQRIHVSDFPRLLDVAGQRSPRDRALVAFMLYTLVRDSEAVSVQVGDLDLPAGVVRVQVHKTKVEDRVPISSELDAEMRTWLEHYTVAVGELKPHYALFPSRQPKPVFGESGKIIAHDTIYTPERPLRQALPMVKPALEGIGLPMRDAKGRSLHEGSHTIRRSGARALFDALVSEGGYDHPLRIVQAMLHHKSVTMTEKYIGVTADRRTRDELIRGKRMYPSAGGVVQLSAVR